ncbi:TolC family protein [Rubinisphaera margarita]|uniref:TolC family protein n=1 Tax=Rubinisphaera margarita TaxID=2909586 RepID=UPI001EE81F2D|nr:TolC family protein [Rubinisphaera margarita]MCG6155373.1 TolC family protein [Rubinisphaera margarita]
MRKQIASRMVLAGALVTLPGCLSSRPKAIEIEPIAQKRSAIPLDQSSPTVAKKSPTESSPLDSESDARERITLTAGEVPVLEDDRLKLEVPLELDDDGLDAADPVYCRPSGGLISLAELETIALGNNPTLKQAESSIVRARGIRSQVRRPANPTVGYFASQLADEGTDQHGVFWEQQIVRGNKLALNDQVLSQTTDYQIWELEAQRLRVLTDVRILYFEAVAAQQRQEATDEFVAVMSQAADISKQRVDALEDSRIDLLQTRIQLNEVELLQRQAGIAFVGAWEELVALVGVQCLEPGPLAPVQTADAVCVDWCHLYDSIQANSPELAAGIQKVSRARALLSRQEVQAIPNLTLELGAGYDNATDSGLINLQVGGPLPIYNRNQGNVTAAYAEFCRATHEVARIRADIRARLARVSQKYDSARVTVAKYEGEILPQAAEALELANSAYELGETDFLQLLVIRRTYFEAKLQAIAARKELAQAQAQLDGLLLTGALTAPGTVDDGDELRGQTLSGE